MFGDSSVQLNIGSLETTNGRVSVHFVVPQEGDPCLHLVTTDASALRVLSPDFVPVYDF